MTRITPDWIAVDWGTSSLRAQAVTGDRITDLGHLPRGMNTLAPGEFEPVLTRLLAQRDLIDMEAPLHVVACGMVGARQGWIEAPYRMTPCAPLGPELVAAPVSRPNLTVHIVPGVAQADPPDVMRGEETQVAGFLALNPGWDGMLCLPGTHSKWIAVSAGEITGFRTVMTGEVFALLSTQSVLRHSMPEAPQEDDTSRAAFAEGVADAMASPDQLLARLFTLRASGLLSVQDAQATRARLSGLLIGAELAATRHWWLGNRIGLIAAGPLAGAYDAALRQQGLFPEIIDMGAATLAGLSAARTSL